VIDVADSGSDTVTGYRNNETIQLTNFGYADVAEASLDFAQIGSDVVFTNGAVTVTFVNETLSDVLMGVEVVGGSGAFSRTAPDIDLGLMLETLIESVPLTENTYDQYNAPAEMLPFQFLGYNIDPVDLF